MDREREASILSMPEEITNMNVSRPPTTLQNHVVCVDDDSEFLKSLEFFLPEQINAGDPPGCLYRFLFLDDPLEALEALRELKGLGETVAMLISDQKMPRMKGTEFFAEARKISDESIRVLLTGHAGMDSAITAINNKLLDKYLTKPIDNEHDFTLSIQHLLGQFQMKRTIATQERAIHDLYTFSNDLNAKEDFAGTLKAILSFCAQTLPCEQFAILLIEDGTLRLADSVGMAGMSGQGPHTAFRPALVDEILQSRCALVADSPERFGTAVEGDRALFLPLRGPVLYAGLACADQPLGFLVGGGCTGDHRFSEAEVEAFTHIAHTAAIAIHNQTNRHRLQTAYSETKAQAAELEEANRRLKVLDDLKTNFLIFISHELRTPLHAMAVFDLADQCQDPQEVSELINLARQGYEGLERFVVKSLDYFEWLAAAHPAPTDAVDLAAFAREVTFSPGSQTDRNIDFGLSVPDAPCLVKADAGSLREVIQILLNNAVKFSPGDKRIRVTVTAGAGSATLSVSDSGLGFPSELAKELFNPFTIADPLHHGQGTALSLAKASAIIASMGGRIEAASDGTDKGATFSVILPVAGALEPPPAGAAGI